MNKQKAKEKSSGGDSDQPISRNLNTGMGPDLTDGAQAVSGLQDVSGPRDVSGSQDAPGPQDVSGQQDDSGMEDVSGPQEEISGAELPFPGGPISRQNRLADSALNATPARLLMVLSVMLLLQAMLLRL
jgi:hypothetical protein